MNVSGEVPNLINGVSRQSPGVRLVTQLEESVNQYPTITRGLVPRSPMVHVANLPALSGAAAVHLIDRDESERYVASIGAAGVRVWDLAGAEKTVSASPAALAYLAGAGPEAVETMTVGDYTFVLNRERTVQKSASPEPGPSPIGLIYVVDGQFRTDYRVWVNGNLVAHFKAGGGQTGSDTAAREAERITTPRQIAAALLTGVDTDGNPLTNDLSGVAVEWMTRALPSAVWGYTRLNNVIVLTRKDGRDFTLRVEADNPLTLRAIKDVVADYSSLPKTAPEGFTVKVTGDERSQFDDYFVRFTAADGGEGGWKECPAPSKIHAIDPATMPHVLVRNADGTFTLRPEQWGKRPTGDEKTNPWPSFVGQKIAGMVFSKNRLGFFHGESVAMSRHGKFKEFFTESLLTQLDTDPVDVSISYPAVSMIRHLLPAGPDLVAFTSSVPFRLTHGGELFTHSTAEFQPLAENRSISRARPVAVGGRIYFSDDGAGGSRVFELTTGDSPSPWEPAEDVTAHVTGYLPGDLTRLVASDNYKVLFCFSPSNPAHLWVYRWKWIGTDKVQAAWQKWDLSAAVGTIRDLKVIEDNLVIVADKNTRSVIAQINLHEAGAKNGAREVYLDLLTSPAGTYDAAEDLTRYTLPYDATPAIAFSTLAESFGVLPEIAETSGQVISVRGDTRGDQVHFGIPFESYGVLSPLLYRPTGRDGRPGNATAGFDTWVASVHFAAAETAFLQVELTRAYRGSYTQVLSGANVGSAAGMLGSLGVGNASRAVSCMARSGDMTLKFGFAGPYPYSVNGLRWSGRANPVTY